MKPPRLNAPAGTLAAAIEAERYDVFGLEQAQLRISCHVILSAIYRLGITEGSAIIQALEKYPAAEWHADREPFRTRAPSA